MRQLTPHEIQKVRMLKACRAAIRLKHSLKADEECYQRLPEFERRIDSALLEGQTLNITTAELLEE